MRSAKYLQWIELSDQLFVMQKRNLLNQTLCGNFHFLLELVRPDNRRRDGDNYFKAPLDYATRIGLIKDDSGAETGKFAWLQSTEDLPSGCRLTIWDAE